MLTLNHGYQKLAGMVGIAYQTAMSGLEGAAKMMGSLVLLDGLSVAMAKNEEIKDILTQWASSVSSVRHGMASNCYLAKHGIQ